MELAAFVVEEELALRAYDSDTAAAAAAVLSQPAGAETPLLLSAAAETASNVAADARALHTLAVRDEGLDATTALKFKSPSVSALYAFQSDADAGTEEEALTSTTRETGAEEEALTSKIRETSGSCSEVGPALLPIVELTEGGAEAVVAADATTTGAGVEAAPPEAVVAVVVVVVVLIAVGAVMTS